MFVLPDTTELGAGGDKVLVAGPSKYDSAVIDTDTWVWTDVVEAGRQRRPGRHRPAAHLERPLLGHRLARALGPRRLHHGS